MKDTKLIVSGSIFVLSLAFFIGTYLYKTNQKESFSDFSENNSQYFERDYSPTLGPKDAKVTLVEFLDPECETCRAFAPLVKEILAKWPDKVRLVVRYAPFHGNSKMIIRVLEASKKQNLYWQTLDVLFKSQPVWGDHHHPDPDKIWMFLPNIGLDIEKLKEDMKDPAIDKIIEQDIADGKHLGVRKTPTFFVNGKSLPSFGYEQLVQAVIDEAGIDKI